MTTHETETLLRALAEGDAPRTTAEDPWRRVERAWRRDRRRRRGAAAGALLAVAAIGAGTVVAQPWHPTRSLAPAERPGRLDDGVPRGPLGGDAGLRDAVRAALGDPAARLVWGGELDGARVALAVTEDRLTWLTGNGPGGVMQRSLSVLKDSTRLATHRWKDRDGIPHLLVVVPRGAGAESSRGEITGQGRVRRTWREVPLTDGWADVPALDQAARGPLVIRSDASPGTSADTIGEPVRPTDADVTRALDPDSGPGVAAGEREDVRSALTLALEPFGGSAAERDARVLYSRSLPAEEGGGSIVIATAGLPGQGRGRLMVGVRFAPDGKVRWRFRTTQPAGPFTGVQGWRVRQAGERDEIAGWLTEQGGTFRVEEPDGPAFGEGTRIGWVRVRPGEGVRLRGRDEDGGRVDLLLGPEALDDGDGAPPWALPGEQGS